MPRIFDNIEQDLVSALVETLKVSERADFCVGYFNLRGWQQLDSHIENWSGGKGNCCRLLVGMQRLPGDELREALSVAQTEERMDNRTAAKLKKRMAQQFREQLTFGCPTNQDEAGLRRLAAQIKAGKVVVKLFLLHPLHAKLYLLFRPDPVNPVVGYLGSSNLTLSGLLKQGELNVDVMDRDACQKLAGWFEDRWNEHWCIDISNELVEIINESWAREVTPPPYHIYLKMAYHLCREARDGLLEFGIPRDFETKLFEFQKAAVKIAAHHLNKRGGVLIGDVVGLGKTLMACALARIFEDDFGLETLIICPKNLDRMWNDYKDRYRLRGRVVPVSQAIQKLPDLRRFRLVVIDESHNLRNREGKRFRAIQEYIRENESKVVLLTATPYNKTYKDLSNQLRLFVPDDTDIGIRPEMELRRLGETEFIRQHQCPVRSLAAFDHSEHADDWRELMRLYMVRRTRSFIKDNYAETDTKTGRKYLVFEDGRRQPFPTRIPRTVKFRIDESDPEDQYARLYATDVVATISNLYLPRYGLGNYAVPSPKIQPTQSERKKLDDLARGGRRLMGFCRTNLFKRLESGGQAFIQSVRRHVLRNYVYLHAAENGLELPIGTQDAGMLDPGAFDGDVDLTGFFDDDDTGSPEAGPVVVALRSEADFRHLAKKVYEDYATRYRSRFAWLRADLFQVTLAKYLKEDAQALMRVLKTCGDWDPDKDTKLAALLELLTRKHPDEKVIVFSQFADTVEYLERELQSRGVEKLAGVTGGSPDPTALAWRFSPVSNEKRDRVSSAEELRVLVATDVLSEGQNLQDCRVVVNYDLPWAIIRLVQRAGRVDRIGQDKEEIYCYSFLPAEGVERIIHLRTRVRQRLQENAEVVGTDEMFFEDEHEKRTVLDLYNEKAGILDGEDETEVDLASYAYQIWKNVLQKDPGLEKIVPNLPAVVYSTRPHCPEPDKPEGVLVYVRTGEGNDALAWIDKSGKSITESQFAILKAAKCEPDTPALPRQDKHHQLVRKGVTFIAEEEKLVGGQLGRPSGARFRTYERLKTYAEKEKDSLFKPEELGKTLEDIYKHPLRQSATDTLNRQLRSGVSDEDLAKLVVELRADGRLCIVHEEERAQEPEIICSLGLVENKKAK